MPVASRLSEWLRQLDARIFPPPPPEIHNRLERVQLKLLQRRVPLLHVVALLNMLLVIIIAVRDGASGSMLLLLALVPAFNASRIVTWRRRKPVEIADVDIPKVLKASTIAVIFGLSIATGLCLYTYAAHVFSEPAIIPVSLAYGTFCVAHSLAPMRRAAVLAIIVGIVPNAIIMATSDDFLSRMLAIGGMTVAVLLTRFIMDQFDQMIAALKLEQQIEDQANTDPLTGILNRRGVLGRLERLAGPDQPDRRAAVALIDLDGFKQINDRMGHFAGDEYLALVAARIQGAIVGPGFAGRLGGDEFVVVFDRAIGDPDVAGAVQSLLAAICQPLIVEGQSVPVSASLGYAFCPEDASDTAELLVAADIALYAAKGGGKAQAKAYADVRTEDITGTVAA